jgi:hypothetical protein
MQASGYWADAMIRWNSSGSLVDRYLLSGVSGTGGIISPDKKRVHQESIALFVFIAKISFPELRLEGRSVPG